MIMALLLDYAMLIQPTKLIEYPPLLFLDVFLYFNFFASFPTSNQLRDAERGNNAQSKPVITVKTAIHGWNIAWS